MWKSSGSTGAQSRNKSKWDSDSSEEESPQVSARSVSGVPPPSPTLRTQQSLTERSSGDECSPDGKRRKVHAPAPSSSSPPSVPPGTRAEHRPAHEPLIHGCRSVDEYQRLNFIDQGTYGAVFKAKCRASGEVVALKQVKDTGAGGGLGSRVGFPVTALREINILLALRHPNIVRVREMVVGSSVDLVFMVMDFADCDLKQCMESAPMAFSLGECKRIILQMLDALAFMHARWFIHRDLKTSNILYNNARGSISVCDFGMARKYGDPLEPYTAEVVTLWYRAPELLLGSRLYSCPLDVWSAGCIAAELLSGGRPLFMGQGEADQVTKIFKVLGSPTEDRWHGVSKLPLHAQACYRAPSRCMLRDLFPAYVSAGSGATAGASGASGADVYAPRGQFGLTAPGFALLSGLLHMDPNQRLSGEAALDHAWLREEAPLPTPCPAMPKFDLK